MTEKEKVVVRIDPRNANHHLWKNNGTWWCHFTIHRPDYTKKRVRISLRTRRLNDARRKRDSLLAPQPFASLVRLALVRGIE